MSTCARPPAWAEGRMAPFTQQFRCARVHILNAARLTRLGQMARMPDGSVVEQLLFAEGLVGLGGVVGRPCSTWQDRAFATPSQVLTSRLAEWGWFLAGSGPSAVAFPFVTAPSSLLDPLCLAALNTGIPPVGPLPVTLTLTLEKARPGVHALRPSWQLLT
eukprot:212566-Chlamydomonas_euryale.AAC.1